jgi:hypothetical protein
MVKEKYEGARVKLGGGAVGMGWVLVGGGEVPIFPK